MHRSVYCVCSSIALLAVVTTFSRQVRAAEGAPAPDDKQIAELEKTLSNATLVGHFTVTGEEAVKPEAERYELGEVRHLGKGQWLISARIRYGEHDVAIPLTLPIRWAGDTPVICVDEMTIPGLGAFTARVMIFHDHYAGFWSGEDHGGHLFGVVERGKPEGAEIAEGTEIKKADKADK